MKATVYFSVFYDAFQAIRPDNFSRAGLVALFDYLEDYEYNTGEELTFDVISLCCDFSEYESMARVMEAYDMSEDGIHDNTTVIEFDGGVIIQAF